jgi:hypothetical protein
LAACPCARGCGAGAALSLGSGLDASTRGLSTTITRDRCFDGDAVAAALPLSLSLLPDECGECARLLFFRFSRFRLSFFLRFSFLRFSFLAFFFDGDDGDDGDKLLPRLSRLCERARFSRRW